MPKSLLTLALLFAFFCLTAQPNFTANDQVPNYEEPFLLGTNPGYYNGWDDEGLADIVAGSGNLRGVGVRTQRVPLPDEFLEQWGVEVRVDEMEYYESVGLKEHVVFLEGPSDAHQDLTMHCADAPSALFQNMYEPIWLNGDVNPNNYYAQYVKDVATNYGQFIKTYEVFNEPDFDYSGNGFKDIGEAGNWYENIPSPCDIKIRAPIFQYIRMLRITYEVVKTYDSESFVAVGGLGYPSFLDLILRHTDNPNQGLVASGYEQKGGAYFDMMSYHSYPHFALRDYNSDINDFEYFRHSDAAVEEVIDHKYRFQNVLEDYGYDGSTYPTKEFIITESNLPRVAFDNFIGSEIAQTNFLMKMQMACLQHGIRQFHVFKTGESKTEANMSSPFHAMGFFKDLEETSPGTEIEVECALGSAVMTSQLEGWKFDHEATESLDLPDNIGGGALENRKVVLWAKTSLDQSEDATATYSLPSDWEDNVVRWDWNQYNEVGATLPAQNIALTSRPTFLQTVVIIDNVNEVSQSFSLYPNLIGTNEFVSLENQDEIELEIIEQSGKLIFDQRYLPGIHKIDWQNKTPGMYFVRIKTGGSLFTQKIMIQ